MNALRLIGQRIRHAKLCSPAGFGLRAGSLLILFLIVHLAGFREYASVLSGTVPQGSFGTAVDQFFAVAYVFLYLGAVVVAPILAIAALVFLILDRWLFRRRPTRTGVAGEGGTNQQPE